MNLGHGTLEIKDYMTADNGAIDLPMINPKYDGKKNCFTYLAHYFSPKVVDENYNFPLTKYDSCKGEVAATYSAPTTLAQEPNFVPNPNGTEEDDGLILTHTYDFMKQETKLTVLDAKDMSVLNEYPSPFRIPIGFHSAYFPKSTEDII